MEYRASPSHYVLALGCGAALSFPIVSLLASLVVLPLFVLLAVGAFVNAGPLLIGLTWVLQRVGLTPVALPALIDRWLLATIVWAGAAYGLSNWDTVGATLGAQRMTYLDAFFGPFSLLKRAMWG